MSQLEERLKHTFEEMHLAGYSFEVVKPSMLSERHAKDLGMQLVGYSPDSFVQHWVKIPESNK